MSHTTTSLLNIPSPAKLNLFLHVLGRRPDGYHELQTLFQLLDYGDELDFHRRDDGVIHLRTALPGVNHDDNLVVRAARLLQQETGCRSGADMDCRKRLPLGAGWGGGSSNAASTLLALDRLWGLKLSTAELAGLGLRLGADVPVFVHGRTAWGEGVGEQLTPVDLPPRWYLVMVPQCPVSTAEIFKSKELTRNTPPLTIAAFLGGGGHNDCQPVVAQRYPAVRQALDWLGTFSPSRLTGTGSAVFASFPNEKAARDVLRQMPTTLDGHGTSGFVASGVNISPLLTALP